MLFTITAAKATHALEDRDVLHIFLEWVLQRSLFDHHAGNTIWQYYMTK